jgi:DNA mismatch endonuclease (patch repair protein)
VEEPRRSASGARPDFRPFRPFTRPGTPGSSGRPQTGRPVGGYFARRPGASMTDRLTPERRSELMSRVRSRDTAPELALRRSLRRLGVRYRSYRRVAGATVDVALPDLRTVVLVHGCFWHGCPRHFKPPKSRTLYWTEKIRTNRARDRRQLRSLRIAGWTALVVWAHDLRTDPDLFLAGALGLDSR